MALLDEVDPASRTVETFSLYTATLDDVFWPSPARRRSNP